MNDELAVKFCNCNQFSIQLIFFHFLLCSRFRSLFPPPVTIIIFLQSFYFHTQFENKNFLMPFQMFCYTERQHSWERKKKRNEQRICSCLPQKLSGLSIYVQYTCFAICVCAFFSRSLGKSFLLLLFCFRSSSFIWVVCSIPPEIYILCTQLPNIPSHASKHKCTPLTHTPRESCVRYAKFQIDNDNKNGMDATRARQQAHTSEQTP